MGCSLINKIACPRQSTTQAVVRVAVVLIELVYRDRICYQTAVGQVARLILDHAPPVKLPHEIRDLVCVHGLRLWLPEIRYLLTGNRVVLPGHSLVCSTDFLIADRQPESILLSRHQAATT